MRKSSVVFCVGVLVFFGLIFLPVKRGKGAELFAFPSPTQTIQEIAQPNLVTLKNIFTTKGLPEIIVVSPSNAENTLLLSQFTLNGGETWQTVFNHVVSPYLIGIVPRDDPQNPIRLFFVVPEWRGQFPNTLLIIQN